MLEILAEYLDISAELWYILDDTKNTWHCECELGSGSEGILKVRVFRY